MRLLSSVLLGRSSGEAASESDTPEAPSSSDGEVSEVSSRCLKCVAGILTVMWNHTLNAFIVRVPCFEKGADLPAADLSFIPSLNQTAHPGTIEMLTVASQAL